MQEWQRKARRLVESTKSDLLRRVAQREQSDEANEQQRKQRLAAHVQARASSANATTADGAASVDDRESAPGGDISESFTADATATAADADAAAAGGNEPPRNVMQKIAADPTVRALTRLFVCGCELFDQEFSPLSIHPDVMVATDVDMIFSLHFLSRRMARLLLSGHNAGRGTSPCDAHTGCNVRSSPSAARARSHSLSLPLALALSGQHSYDYRTGKFLENCWNVIWDAFFALPHVALLTIHYSLAQQHSMFEDFTKRIVLLDTRAYTAHSDSKGKVDAGPDAIARISPTSRTLLNGLSSKVRAAELDALQRLRLEEQRDSPRVEARIIGKLPFVEAAVGMCAITGAASGPAAAAAAAAATAAAIAAAVTQMAAEDEREVKVPLIQFHVGSLEILQRDIIPQMVFNNTIDVVNEDTGLVRRPA